MFAKINENSIKFSSMSFQRFSFKLDPFESIFEKILHSPTHAQAFICTEVADPECDMSTNNDISRKSKQNLYFMNRIETK